MSFGPPNYSWINELEAFKVGSLGSDKTNEEAETTYQEFLREIRQRHKGLKRTLINQKMQFDKQWAYLRQFGILS